LGLPLHDKKKRQSGQEVKNNRKVHGSSPAKIVGKLKGMKRIKAALGLPLVKAM
jgi:hypothetical protein